MENIPTHLLKNASSHGADSNRGRLASVFASRPVSRKAAVLMAVAAAMPVATHLAHAGGQGSGGYSSIASKEIARRAQLVAEADKAVALGRAAYAKKDFAEAHKQYQMAVGMLPPGPALADRRNSYTGHLGDAAVALAQKHRRVGKYSEARSLLDNVLRRDPANFAAKKQLEYLDDPIRNNPALTYEHTQDVDRVRKHLYMGEGYYNLGKFDEASVEFGKVLKIDEYNKAARRWLEKIAATKSDYYRSAYDHTRSQLLMEVDRAWEMAVPNEQPTSIVGPSPSIDDASGMQYIQRKLDDIIIPIVDFENTTVEEALAFLRGRAFELDPEPDTSKKGINFVIRKPRADAAADGGGGGEVDLDAGAGEVSNPGALRIETLKLTNVPLGQVLSYIVEATRLRYKVDAYSVIILPVDALEVTDLYNLTFTVPPDFMSKLDGGSAGGATEPADPFGTTETGSATLKPRPPVKELLMQNGVSFPDGASARYNAGSSTLIVKNTKANLDIIEQIIDTTIGSGPRQVRIMTKFIEVSQENSDELGFDWIINPVGIANNTFIGGGTVGNGAGRVASDFNPVNGVFVDGVSDSISHTSTAGLRSGDYATTRNNIDAILNNPDRTAQATNVAPGILSLTGLFTDGDMQMIMRGLAQKKGTDVLTAPSVLARSGETATIEVIREFLYPTEYEPPEIPNTIGGAAGGIGGDDVGGGIFPVTPATPTAFETRNTGVTLQIQPTIDQNNYMIDLTFSPELVEFEGFINYGSPIQSPASDIAGNPIQLTITENRIEQPVFSTRKVTTALNIYDGYTVAVGGLMREDVQNVEDKVPILGDLPLIGRLFQTKSENRIKSNLIIFVTAQIVDPAGAPINGNTSDASAVMNPVSMNSAGDGSQLLPPPGN